MKVNIIIHETAELDDWEEKIESTLKGKIEPLDLSFTKVPRCFDITFGIDEKADANIAILAPKKEYIPVFSGLVKELISKNVRIFFGTYDEMPSLLEDFLLYVENVLGIEG